MAARKNPRNAPKGSVDPTASTLAQGVSSAPDDPMADMLAQQQAAAEAAIAAEEAQPQSDPEPDAADKAAVLQDIVTPIEPPAPTPNQKRMERAQSGTKASAADVVTAFADGIKNASAKVPAQGERPVSLRRQRQQRNAQVSTVQQLRQFGRPEGDLTGTATYWIRPGATIRDALILNPNGGVPNIDDTQLAAKYGTNANYYRDRALKKGFEYIGPSLTPQGIRRLIEVMEAEKPDEILFLEEEIEIAIANSKEAGSLEARANEGNRARQLQRRLDLVRKPIDAQGLMTDLDRIRRAQELAKLTPSMRAAISALFTQVLEELGPLAASIAEGRGAGTRPSELAGVTYGGEGVAAPDEGLVRGGAMERMNF